MDFSVFFLFQKFLTDCKKIKFLMKFVTIFPGIFAFFPAVSMHLFIQSSCLRIYTCSFTILKQIQLDIVTNQQSKVYHAKLFSIPISISMFILCTGYNICLQNLLLKNRSFSFQLTFNFGLCVWYNQGFNNVFVVVYHELTTLRQVYFALAARAK